MAERRRKRSRAQSDDLPGWMWMLFGLAIGLAVAVMVFINGRPTVARVAPVANSERATVVQEQTARVAPENANLDRNGEPAAVDVEETPKQRFDFYNMLPNYEVVIPEEEPDVARDVVPRAITVPGEYVLQAGSFSRFEDADRRRARLALQGIESTIQRVAIDDKTFHRVRIGPTRDLALLNEQRARLRKARIDVLRIRLGD